VTAFGAWPDDSSNDAEAIQKAIDSGKTTVSLPRGKRRRYRIGGTILIRDNVGRLIGCESEGSY